MNAVTVRAGAIPVIDVADLDSATTLWALDDACRDWGFFHAVHHGIPRRVCDGVMRDARAFFAQSHAAKRAIERTADNPWGYFDRELTKNTRDWKETFDYGPSDGGALVPQWPAAQPTFRRSVLAFYNACEDLAFRLLHALARNLGLPHDGLDAAFDPAHTSFMRLNHYPPCAEPARPLGVCTPKRGYLGVNHHTDSGVLTLLLQDEHPGLEVLHEGQWRLVAPRADSLVVNIGDIVQVWSNDRYRAALHRVIVNPDNDRLSVPFFLNPTYEATYAPLPTVVDATHPPRYRAIRWGEFRARRTAGDYSDLGAEVQITDYRLTE